MLSGDDPVLNFWGLEVPPGVSVPVDPKEGNSILLHLSQACFGVYNEENGNERVLLHATIDGEQRLLGALTADKFPHLSFDLAFEKEFELSHTWKNGSIHFAGYTLNEDPYSSGEEEKVELTAEDLANASAKDQQEKPAADDGKTAGNKKKVTKVKKEELPAEDSANGKAKGELEKPDADDGKTAGNKKVTKVKEEEIPAEDFTNGKAMRELEKPAADEGNENKKVKKVKKANRINAGKEDKDCEEDSVDEDDNDSDKENLITTPLGGDECDGSDADDETYDDLPKKVELRKKRSAEAHAETYARGKKAKLVTPLNTVFPADGNKSKGHGATPFPSKQAGNPADDKPKKKTPKLGDGSKPTRLRPSTGISYQGQA
ncbi:Histone deacetylase HDT3-like protein [Drosera capensis]